MAIAWSRISSKVIATTPLYADAACRRRCEHGKGYPGTFIPHLVDRRKQEVLGARDAAVTPCSQTQGGVCLAGHCPGRERGGYAPHLVPSRRPRLAVFSLHGVLDYVAYHHTPYVDPGP